MEHIKQFFISGFILLASLLAFTALLAPTVSAQGSAKENLCAGADLSLVKDTRGSCNPKDRNGDGKVDSDESKLDDTVGAIVNILSIIVGIVALIMIIIGGFYYITSSGDSGKISSAKNTVIYAIVGLIIVALAQVIVRFVLNKV